MEITGNVIVEPPRELPLRAETDVVVIGGGTGGVPAAVAAARAGATTLLIERFGRLGGLHTWGWVTKPQGTMIGGIPGEIHDRLLKYGGTALVPGDWQQRMIRRLYFMALTDPETVERVYWELVAEADVHLLLNTLAVDVIIEDNTVRGVIVENKSGRHAILAKVLVDVSGEGDIAARAGAPYEVGRIRDHTIENYPYRRDALTQPASIMMRIGDVDLLKYVEYQKTAQESYLPDKVDCLADVRYKIHGGITFRKFVSDREAAKYPKRRAGLKVGRGLHEVFVNATKITQVYGFDAAGVTEAEVEGRKQALLITDFLVQHVPGFEAAYLLDTTITLGVRETRRFIGEYMVTEDDIRAGRRFKDTVARLFAPIHIIQPDGLGDYTAQFSEYDLPYRCLVPQAVDQLLVAGRQISADHYAHGSTRDVAVCMYSGQAAGAAAALAARLELSPRRLPVQTLQATLQEWGTILFESVFERIQHLYPDHDLQEEYEYDSKG